jgi:hypothetical protein
VDNDVAVADDGSTNQAALDREMQEGAVVAATKAGSDRNDAAANILRDNVKRIKT